jgi:hypothetical protein
MGALLLIVFLSRGLVGTAASLAAVFPTAALLLLITRALSRYSDFRFGRALAASTTGTILYLSITTIVGFLVNLFHEPAAHPTFFNQVAGAVASLREVAGAMIDAFPAGPLPTLNLFGIGLAQTYSLGTLLIALLALHAPGIAVASLVMMIQIDDAPYEGFSGFIKGCAVLALSLFMGLTGGFWIVGLLFRHWHSL